MAEKTSMPSEISDSNTKLITRRRLLKQAGATGIALTALYAAPSFSSFGPRQAFASVTGSTPCETDLCLPDKVRPAYLTMIYTGDSGAGSNSQTGTEAPIISGDPVGASPVTIKWVDKNDTTDVFATFSNVAAGGSFVLDHALDDHAHPHLGSTTRLLICNAADTALLQDIKFHTSCSAPLFLGDTFGSVELAKFINEDGREDCEPGSTSADLCEGRVKAGILHMMYTGAAASSHTQDPTKVTITDSNGGPGATDPVFIVVKNSDGSKTWFTGPVALGGTFDIDSATGGATKLDTETKIYIYASEGGTLLQTARFHTSCSQPLKVDDQFGASKVIGLTLGS
ncbi:MAG: hypothetical protein O3B95_11585 [Chloroflexi bacterium]|nr:hypothetical protein [Chloroflexota bacterium]